MQVLSNEVLTEKFKPARGVRQGCPLLLYLFVLCIEWLGHNFKTTISTGKSDPIRLPRSSPTLFHLFFVDNLVIFSRADTKHGFLLKFVMDQFCSISCHRVNARKTNIFFSKGVNDNLSMELSSLLGF